MKLDREIDVLHAQYLRTNNANTSRSRILFARGKRDKMSAFHKLHTDDHEQAPENLQINTYLAAKGSKYHHERQEKSITEEKEERQR